MPTEDGIGVVALQAKATDAQGRRTREAWQVFCQSPKKELQPISKRLALRSRCENLSKQKEIEP